MDYPFHLIELLLSDDQARRLRDLYARLLQDLERQHVLQPALFRELMPAMRECLFAQPGFDAVWQEAYTRHCTLHLTHADNDILNLPWRLAAAERPFLYLTKGLPGATGAPFQPSIPLPLKILVMVAAPESGGARLSYEEEEMQIIRAFEPLFGHGQVQVDFTDDGSLPALQEKLRQNPYHILHFSGHGVYGGGEGHLLLEDEHTLDLRPVNAADFARALNVRPEHRPPLVLLSACQSGQGAVTEAGFQGAANHLLRSGVPAVIAMGFSILDHFATEFAAHFYREIAGRNHLAAAFQAALQHIEQLENALRQHQPTAPPPAQWMIPQYYATRQLVHLADWKAPEQNLKRSAVKFATGRDRLLLAEQPGYLFIGRRRERKAALRRLDAEAPVLLRGQGGVGKTALAEHLTARRIAANPKVQPFVVNEQKTRNIVALNKVIADYIDVEGGRYDIHSQLAAIPEEMEKFRHLMMQLRALCQPLFVFDNLESFQEAKGGAFREEHSDIRHVLEFLLQRRFPVICTSRYALADFPQLEPIDLNQVSYPDFFKKCEQLSLSGLRARLDREATAQTPKRPGQPASFSAVIQLLHRTLGGNYRALEYFDRLYQEQEARVYATLEKLDEFREQIGRDKSRVLDELHEGAKSLVFGELLALLTPAERAELQRLARFRAPVLDLALRMQAPAGDPAAALRRLTDLTLIEHQQRPYDNGRLLSFYYVTPLVRDWLAEAGLPETAFSHEAAGRYFEYADKHVNHKNYSDLEEAFYHYCLAGNKERVNETGGTLCRYYYNMQIFENALFFGKQTEALLGASTHPATLDFIGQVHLTFGQSDAALEYFEKNLQTLRAAGNRRGEGATLNNIGHTYIAKGDYDMALDYLEQSLEIQQEKEIGDRQGEGGTLNNISQIYKVKGDYNRALDYLEQSLKILQEIGDRLGEVPTLNNIGQIYKAQGNYSRALGYLERSLEISQAISDHKGEGVVLNNISQIYLAKGDYDRALRYLEQSLKIRQQIGDRLGEGATLNNIGQLYSAKGEYDRALGYLEQSLKICQQIGERHGSISTLHNMAQIAREKEAFRLYFKYERQAWQIANEIRDAMGIYQVGKDLGAVLCYDGEAKEGLPMLQAAYQVALRAGLPGAAELKELIGRFSGGGA